jgi:hypothetical protein
MMLADQAVKQDPVENKQPAWSDYGPYFSQEQKDRVSTLPSTLIKFGSVTLYFYLIYSCLCLETII